MQMVDTRMQLNAYEALHSQIQFEPGFTAVNLLHPATYLNKVLVGGNDGSLQLWNIRTQCVQQYTCQINSSKCALGLACTKYPSLAPRNHRLITCLHLLRR
jgi:hypothetical protein